MKNIRYTAYKFALLLTGSALLLSCNDFLDEMPDNRTELDTPQKLSQMLVSAYSETLPLTMQELMSDNVSDYGSSIDVGYDIFQESYLFRDITDTSFDSPEWVWEHNYKAVAAANHVLEAIGQMDTDEDLSAQEGEALVCRAYAHFTLCNTFCQAYNPQTSNSDLGIAYIEQPEKSVFEYHDRGTVAEVYEKIARDLEVGIPLIDDTKYSQPKYHFTRKAACAFAAQFYLYYGKYDLAAQYATNAVGADPTSLFRNWDLFTGTSSQEYSNAYVATDEAANIFNQGSRGIFGRRGPYRYVLTFGLLSEIFNSQGPWSAVSSTLPAYGTTYVYSSRSYFFPKINEYFMYSDVAQQIGQPYVVQVVYSTEKTIIDRAEAYVMQKEYTLAARDLNYFYRQAGANTSLSAEQIASFYETAGSMYKKELAPRFEVEQGMQTNLLHACLHARRIAAAQEGTRLNDLKRYGIAYTHVCDGASNIEIEPYDKRLAVQIPNAVVSAGVTPNPR